MLGTGTAVRVADAQGIPEDRIRRAGHLGKK